MDVIIGMVLGYILGSRIGGIDIDETTKAWGEIKKSEEFRTLLGGLVGIIKSMISAAPGTLVEEVSSAAASKLTIGQRLRLFLFGNA